MKKVFLHIVLILMAAFIASSFLSGFGTVDDATQKAANAMRSSMNILLIASFVSWLAGSLLGVLVGMCRAPFKNTVLFIFESLLKIPFFLITAIAILLLGNSMFSVTLATMLPVFFMTTTVAAKSMAEFKRASFADFMPSLGARAFWKEYFSPVVAAPIAIAFLRGFRILLYIDLSLGILGIMPSYTLGGIVSQLIGTAPGFESILALAISVILIVFINIACLLANSLLAPKRKAASVFSNKKVRR